MLALLAFFAALLVAHGFRPISQRTQVASTFQMKVDNDAFRKANRAMRSAGADERMVELKMPMGMELDEDKDGNVYVKSIDKGGRAEKSGKVFVGDIIAMASATFGDDLWSCRGVGLGRVLSTIKVRNTKPVKLVLEAPNEQEEKKRRAIAFAEESEQKKEENRVRDEQLLKDMLEEDKDLLKKRKGLFGLW